MVEQATGAKDIIPVLACFCFDGKTVTGFDDLVAIEAPCELPIHGAIKASVLSPWLSVVAGSEVKVEVKSGVAHFKCGRSSIKVPLLPPEDFLHSTAASKPADKLKPSEAFGPVFAKVMRSQGTDTSDPTNCGVMLDLQSKGAVLYSGDGFSATRVQVAGLKGKGFYGLTPRFADVLGGMLGKFGDVELLCSKDKIEARFESGVRIYGATNSEADKATLEGYFKRVGGKEVAKRLVKVPKTLKSGLEQAVALGTHDRTAHAGVKITKDRLALSLDTEVGKLNYATQMKGHPEVAVKFNPELLLRSIDDAEQITVLEDCIILSGPGYRYIAAVQG